MRVLLVCPKPPFPPVDGGTRAVAELAAGLAAQGHAVHALALATPKHPDRGGPTPPGVRQESIPVDTRLRPLAALANLGRELPYAVERFASAAFAARLGELLAGGPDVVQFEGLPVAPGQRLALAAGARVVFRAHNVEAEIWQQRAAAARGPLRAWWRAQARRVARLEEGCWRSAHAVAAISPAVARACRAVSRGPVLDLPVGLPVPAQPPPIVDPSRLYHLGAMDWGPTADGVAWFLAEAWPRVLERRPTAVLRLAGRRIGAFAPARGVPGVMVDGEVDDADSYVRDGGVLIAPVRSGSGLRVKLVEAMAQGRAVVTTSTGAEGLGAANGKHLLLADDAAGLAEHTLRCLAQPGLVRALGESAHRLARERFERGALTSRLLRLYASLPAPSP